MLIRDKNLLKCLWLDPTILSWNAEPAADRHEEAQWRRPYEIWSHAESLLEGDSSDFKRVDALTTLKRAVDRRVRQLNALHNLKGIPIPDKPIGTLELLKYIGLIRPMMLQRLIEIRNAVEHEDTSPPTVEELLIFLEFVWYFLRSTDNALRHPLGVFHLQLSALDEISPYGFEVTLSPDTNWIPKISGWVEPSMLFAEPKEGWLVVNLPRAETREQVIKRAPHVSYFGIPDERGKNPDDILLSGEVRGPKEAIIQLIRISFRLI